MDRIQRAYKAGQAAAQKHETIEDAVYAGSYEPTMDRAEGIAWDMGFAGRTLKIVTGWRYGKIPAEGVSKNYLDQRYERGVSLMAIDGENTITAQAVAEGMAASSRPVVRVKGYFSGRGACGEPLIIGAEEITD